jgi:uncharacterized protein (TIGR02001 family)
VRHLLSRFLKVRWGMRKIGKDGLGRAKKIAKIAAILSVACLGLLPKPTNADAKYNTLLKFTSNYVYRGYSKSNGAPAFQGNIDYEHPSGFFIGMWVSQVDFGDRYYKDRANIEANPYVGVSFGLSENWRFDTTLAGYLYNGKVYGHEADYSEINALLHFRDWFTARFGVSYDAYGRGRSTLDYEINMRYPVTDTVEVSGGLGYEDANTVLKYSSVYWNIGVGWFLCKHAALALRYYDAHGFDEPEGGAANTRFEPPRIGNPVVFSISIGF